MQGLTDDLVGDVRSVEIARVDVGDPECDHLAQQRDRGCAVAGGPNTPGPASCIAP